MGKAIALAVLWRYNILDREEKIINYATKICTSLRFSVYGTFLDFSSPGEREREREREREQSRVEWSRVE